MKNLLITIVIGMMAVSASAWAGETCCGKTEVEASACPMKAQNPCCSERTVAVKAETTACSAKVATVKTACAGKTAKCEAGKQAKRPVKPMVKGATLFAQL